MKTELINSEAKSFLTENKPELDKIFILQTFRKEQSIFYSGHMPYGLFILLSGEVNLIYNSKKTETIKSNSFLGVSAFLNKKPYSATALATSDCKIYFIGSRWFEEVNGNDSEIYNWIKSII